MPLKIELKPYEKVFINGAVVANGPDRTQLTLLNDAALLREKDILTEERADTPCKRLYLAIQLMYIDPLDTRRYLEAYAAQAQALLDAAPSTAPYLENIQTELVAGRLYPALKAARKLIDYEEELTRHAQQ